MEPVILAALVGIAGGAAAASLAWVSVVRQSTKAIERANVRIEHVGELYLDATTKRREVEDKLAETESALRLRVTQINRADQRIDKLTNDLGHLQSIAYVRNARGQMKRWTDLHG